MHAGKSVRVYGEFVDKPRITLGGKPVRATWSQLWNDYNTGAHQYSIGSNTDNAALRPCLSPNYIGFPLVVLDQWRADQFLADFKNFEQQDSFPPFPFCYFLRITLPAQHRECPAAVGRSR